MGPILGPLWALFSADFPSFFGVTVLAQVRMIDDDFFELEKNRSVVDTLMRWFARRSRLCTE